MGLFTGPQIFTPSSIDVDTDGFLGGGQVGCDYQFDPRWVIGVEGQFSWADISGGKPGARTPNSPFSSSSATFNAKTDWLASATARIGYALDPRWLLYVKGGAAWEHDKYNVQTLVLTLGVPTSETYVASETRVGWTVGGGVEWAFAYHWSTKLEYQFHDFGTKELTFVRSRAGGFDRFVNVEPQIHTLKLGVNYRF